MVVIADANVVSGSSEVKCFDFQGEMGRGMEGQRRLIAVGFFFAVAIVVEVADSHRKFY